MASTLELNCFTVSIEVDPGVALDIVLGADFVLLAAHVHLDVLDALCPFEVYFGEFLAGFYKIHDALGPQTFSFVR